MGKLLKARTTLHCNTEPLNLHHLHFSISFLKAQGEVFIGLPDTGYFPFY